MKTMGIDELQTSLVLVMRELRETGETVELVEDGETVARLVPVRKMPTLEERQAAIRELDALAAQISAHWPEGVTALEAVNDVRRDL